MRRYFSKDDFITFINLLEEDRPVKVFTENTEGGYIEPHEFRKMKFAGEIIVLYELKGFIGVIQDTSTSSWEDYAEGVFQVLTIDGEFKVFLIS